MLVVLASACERHLVGPPGPLDLDPVDHGRPRPSLGGHEQDHRPRTPLEVAVLPGRPLDLEDPVVRLVERGGELAVHVAGVVALDGPHLVAVAAEQVEQLVARDPRRDGRVGDLVAVEVQHRQDRSVVDGVHELVGVPGRGQRTGLELAVPDDGGHHEVRVVHRGAVGVRQDVAELPSLVDRARRLGCHVAGYAAGEGELAEELLHAAGVVPHVRVDLAVGPLEPGVGDRGRATVAGAGEEDRIDVPLADQAVEVRPQQVEARGGAPVAEQARLDVLADQGPAQQGVVHQVDLAHGQVVRRPPPRIERRHLVLCELCVHHRVLLDTAGRRQVPPPRTLGVRRAAAQGTKDPDVRLTVPGSGRTPV